MEASLAFKDGVVGKDGYVLSRSRSVRVAFVRGRSASANSVAAVKTTLAAQKGDAVLVTARKDVPVDLARLVALADFGQRQVNEQPERIYAADFEQASSYVGFATFTGIKRDSGAVDAVRGFGVEVATSCKIEHDLVTGMVGRVTRIFHAGKGWNRKTFSKSLETTFGSYLAKMEGRVIFVSVRDGGQGLGAFSLVRSIMAEVAGVKFRQEVERLKLPRGRLSDDALQFFVHAYVFEFISHLLLGLDFSLQHPGSIPSGLRKRDLPVIRAAYEEELAGLEHHYKHMYLGERTAFTMNLDPLTFERGEILSVAFRERRAIAKGQAQTSSPGGAGDTTVSPS